MSFASALASFRRHAPDLLRWALGALFVFTGAVKISDPLAFLDSLRAYRLALPDLGLRLVAAAFPWIEVVSGILLLANIWRETVRVLIAALGLVFVLVLAQTIVRGLDLNCGCFGRFAPEWLERPPVALVRAGLLFALAGWLALRDADPEPAASSARTTATTNL